ncbi:MAG: sigma-70 family RNA polymerase sigma factor [Chloroflexi bacterium]|nr:sigma-70 family RNA polymerase sigma factor [Chloroflexota bacterium]
MDEQTLLARAREWDTHALAQIYDMYSPRLYRYAMRLLGDEDAAEECVAETFSRFLHALHNGKGPRRALQAYLYRIAHNWITDFYRRRPEDDLEDHAHILFAEGLSPEELVTQRWQQAQVRAVLRQLTPEQRQVIVLKFLEGWSNAEIAEALEKPVGAVKALQHRALARLRRLLSQWEAHYV